MLGAIDVVPIHKNPMSFFLIFETRKKRERERE
jgi:hypothetical protein